MRCAATREGEGYGERRACCRGVRSPMHGWLHCDGVVTGAGGEPVSAVAGGEAQASPQRENGSVVDQAQRGHDWHG
jgi:hypothetical protein